MALLNQLNENFQKVAKKPERFLSVQDEAAKATKSVVKSLYDFLKSEETSRVKSKALPELIVDGFDEEQIWQEIDLQNEAIYNNLVKDVAHLLAKKDRLKFEAKDDKNEISGSEADEDEIEDSSKLGSDSENNDSSELSDDDDLDGGPDDDAGDDVSEEESFDAGKKFSSEIDDEFFKLSEMENFCEKVEKDDDLEKRNSKIPFDFFSEQPENDEDESRLIRFNDFFKTPVRSYKAGRRERNREDGYEKRVHFDEEAFEDRQELVEDENLEDDVLKSFEHSDSVDEPKSSFGARQERLKARIETLEEEAMNEKPWYLKGEVSSGGRPFNSLLEEYVEFDIGARPAPVFTEKTTLRLEDVIRQRIKDKSWDDVARKIKPVEDIREYKKQLVLDQEKSKLSLAEIYEQEYIKRREAAAADPADVKDDEEPKEHVEIKTLIKNLFAKLDALSNFHYTPKPVQPEVKIITNTPAINMEEVAPVGMSDAALLAPEEVKNKPKGVLMSKEERSTTDKKRERRKKKIKQRVREKEKEKKEKLLNKLPLGLGNKYSKEKARKTLDKLTKERNVDKMVETQSKHLNSSSAFFNKLQDEVKSQVKRKAVDMGAKNKKMEKFSAKKIKF